MADVTPRNSVADGRESRAIRPSVAGDSEARTQPTMGRRVGQFALGRTIGAGTTGRLY